LKKPRSPKHSASSIRTTAAPRAASSRASTSVLLPLPESFAFSAN
jgi:hypothetical protein